MGADTDNINLVLENLADDSTDFCGADIKSNDQFSPLLFFH